MNVKTSIFANVLSQIKHNNNNFHPLEVVGRGSETQFRVGENINKIPWWQRVIIIMIMCLTKILEYFHLSRNHHAHSLDNEPVMRHLQ